MLRTVEDNKVLIQFKELILLTCGFSLETGREQSLIEGLSSRMAARGIDKAGAYHALLMRDKEELNDLVELLTVNETYFYREPEYLNLMADRLIQGLMTGRDNRPIRILSAGCSTGEEPYSIAMMLRERFGAESEGLFTITGVDIDSSVITDAKLGIYGKNSFRNLDQTIQERYFKPIGPGKFQVRDIIRKLVRFEVVNLLDNSYPQLMLMPDIIFYRNVSIYFPGPVQREIFNKLAGLLADGGCLLVGATETIHHNLGILTLVEQDSLFYYRKTSPVPLVIEERRRFDRQPATQPKTSGNFSRPTSSAVSPGTDLARTGADKKTISHHTKQTPVCGRNDTRELFDRALNFARNHQETEALAILDELIDQDGKFIKAHTLKGSLLLGASRFDEAGRVCTFVLGQDPLCLEAYLILGIIARQQGNNDDAFKRFREAIYLNASCWLAHFYTAEILFRLDAKLAKKSYETAARILEKGSLKEHGQAFFPLSVNAEQFTVICRHKLALLKEKI